MERTVYDSIADLVLCYPSSKLDLENVQGYARMLSDLPVPELDFAAAKLVRRTQFFPSIAEIRQCVFEQRLGLPGEDDAWAQVAAMAKLPERVNCPNPECRNGLIGSPVQQQISIPDDLESGPFRQLLVSINRSGGVWNTDDICATCGGHGQIENPDRPVLALAVKQALDHIGGTWGIKRGDKPEILRAQFIKSYQRIRDEQVEHVDMLSLTTSPMLELSRGEA